MAVRVTHIRLSAGSGNEHITHLWWTNPATAASAVSTRAEMVKFIENDKGTACVEQRPGHRANVGVRTPLRGEKYVQTYADGEWDNNLLSLPRQ